MDRRSRLAWMLAGSVLLVSPAGAMTGFADNRGQFDPRVRYFARTTTMDVYLTSDALVLDLREPPSTPCVRARKGCAVWVRLAGGAASPVIEGARRLPGKLGFFLGNDASSWRSGVPAFEEVTYREVWPGTDLTLHPTPEGLEYRAVSVMGVPAVPRFSIEGCSSSAFDGRSVWSYSTPGGVLEQELTAGDGRAGRFSFGPRRADRRPAGSTRRSQGRDDPGLIWSTFLGGNSLEWGTSVSTGADGGVVVSGLTYSSNFPTTAGAYDRSYNGNDVFVSRLSAGGDTLVWSTFLGGNSQEECYAMTLGRSGDVVLAGLTLSPDFPTTPDAYDRTANGRADMFVTRLDASGSILRYSTYIGGADDDFPSDVQVDLADQTFIVGRTMSSDFPLTPGAYDGHLDGLFDACVLGLPASGTPLLFSTYLGGSRDDCGTELALDRAGNVVVAGFADSGDFPTTAGAYDTTANGSHDAFVSVMNASGSSLLRSTLLGGRGTDAIQCLALDDDGNCVVSGQTTSPDYPVTPGCFDPSHHGGEDGFVAELDGALHELRWSTYLGGAGYDRAYAFALDGSDDVLVAGNTSSFDFPTTPDALDTSLGGTSDAFVSRLSSSGSELLWSSYLGGADAEECRDLELDAEENPVVIGHTRSADFPTTPGAYDLSWNGVLDAFIAKIRPGGPSGEDVPHDVGHSMSLWLAGPNPTTGAIALRYSLPRPTTACFALCDPSGRLIETRRIGPVAPGEHVLVWSPRREGRPIGPGVYVVRLAAGRETRSGKIIFLP